jgi:hypothetical protein
MPMQNRKSENAERAKESKLLNGTISVKSEYGVGSTFVITLALVNITGLDNSSL